MGRIGAFLISDFATEAQLLAVEDEIHRHRSEGGFQGDEYEIALILVAAARHGADRKVIARETGARNELLEIIENRMVAARLWRDGVVETGGWLEEEGFAGFTRTCLLPSGKAYVSWTLTVSSGTYLRASCLTPSCKVRSGKRSQPYSGHKDAIWGNQHGRAKT